LPALFWHGVGRWGAFAGMVSSFPTTLNEDLERLEC